MYLVAVCGAMVACVFFWMSDRLEYQGGAVGMMIGIGTMLIVYAIGG